jgi:uncharacterized protein (DUF1330 family)
MSSLSAEDIELPQPYGELVRRLLKLFGLDYLHRVKSHRTLQFSWFSAHVSTDMPSGTYLMWCYSDEEGMFFKMADYSLLNCWDEVAVRALETVKEGMVLDDLASS